MQSLWETNPHGWILCFLSTILRYGKSHKYKGSNVFLFFLISCWCYSSLSRLSKCENVCPVIPLPKTVLWLTNALKIKSTVCSMIYKTRLDLADTYLTNFYLLFLSFTTLQIHLFYFLEFSKLFPISRTFLHASAAVWNDPSAFTFLMAPHILDLSLNVTSSERPSVFVIYIMAFSLIFLSF